MRRSIGLSFLIILLAIGFSLAVSPVIESTREAMTVQEERQIASKEEGRIEEKQASMPTAKVLVTLQGFSPSEITVKRGTTVIWENTVDRPVLLNDFSGKFQKKIGLGETFSYTYHIEGSYPYQDGIINWRGKALVVP